MSQHSAGARFRQAVKESNPLAVVGCVNAYFARLATQSGFKAIYLSGGAWQPALAVSLIWALPQWKMC